MQQAAELLLMFGVYPLWVAAGLADWACHRSSAIERTSGWRENLLHWLLFGQVGLGIAAAAFLEPNAALLAWIAAVFLAHELTVYAELRYAVVRREVRPFEQMVHSFLELLPLASLALLAVLAWDRLADWGLHARREPLPPAYLLTAGLAALLFNVLPLAEESWRCLRWRTLRPPAPR